MKKGDRNSTEKTKVKKTAEDSLDVIDLIYQDVKIRDAAKSPKTPQKTHCAHWSLNNDPVSNKYALLTPKHDSRNEWLVSNEMRTTLGRSPEDPDHVERINSSCAQGTLKPTANNAVEDLKDNIGILSIKPCDKPRRLT